MRIWTNRDNVDRSVHCMGNGRLAVYAMGPELLQVFGPPYSSTSFMQSTIVGPGAVEVRSNRERGAAIWQHEVLSDGGAAGSMVDFVDADLPAFVRILHLTRPLSFDVRIDEAVEAMENGERFGPLGAEAGLLARSERGAFVFMKYPSPVRFDHQIVVKGAVSMKRIKGSSVWRIECAPASRRS